MSARQARWTACVLDPSASSSAPTTLCSARPERETIGRDLVGLALFRLSTSLESRAVVSAHRKGHYTEGAELIDSVLDVVRKEAEGCDCL